MKRKAVAAMMILAMAVSITACGTQKTDVSVNETETTAETEAHVHAYKEEVTKEASCEETGEKTFTCVCGESYTESIPATGHAFESYVYNEDATYLADGTETAICVCGLEDTRVAEGTKLEYTYTDLSATKYAKKSVNVRSLPSTDGEKVGSLSMNKEVKVTGQCNETNWYRIEFEGAVAYVSNNYLINEKIVIATMPSMSEVNDGSNNIINTGNNTESNSTPEQQSEPEQEQIPEVNTEPVKNPNGYTEVTSAEYWAGGLAPGNYYLVDTDQTVTIHPPTSGGQTENESGTIINGDTGEIIRPATP